MSRGKYSAGVLLYRRRMGDVEVFIGHPGGPYFRRREKGAWTIPKGKIEADEQPLTCALREFEEEIGIRPDPTHAIDLGTIRQKGGKQVHAFAIEYDSEISSIDSDTFEMEWPPRSGNVQTFPEIDDARFVSIAEARVKLNVRQVALLDRLLEHLEN